MRVNRKQVSEFYRQVSECDIMSGLECGFLKASGLAVDSALTHPSQAVLSVIQYIGKKQNKKNKDLGLEHT